MTNKELRDYAESYIGDALVQVPPEDLVSILDEYDRMKAALEDMRCLCGSGNPRLSDHDADCDYRIARETLASLKDE